MRIFITALLLLASHALASEWVVTNGGLSPDKKLAVAVFPQKTEIIDKSESPVLLIDQTTGRKIGPLEEVDSFGGGWGTTTTNVHCVWSADSTILIVNVRSGRMMRGSQNYRIKDRRAIPVDFPESETHPKGIPLKGIQTTSNPGGEMKITKDGTLLDRVWGLIPDSKVDYAKHGLEGFSGTLEFHYRFDRKGRLILHDITVPKNQ